MEEALAVEGGTEEEQDLASVEQSPPANKERCTKSMEEDLAVEGGTEEEQDLASVE